MPRIPLAFFGISLGLAGLAGTWLTAAHEGHVPIDVGRALVALAAVVWCVTLLLYLRYAVSPPGLTPTLAIEVVPASMASVACFALNHDRIDRLSAVLAGYCLLMILAQVRLLPLFLRLRFTPGFWAFTFSWMASFTSCDSVC
ncbi:hypothetical protein [Streptomyces sp. NPDC005262]|uniref:hypothetical protein n=1 Tax=Streptomyces sp. NPDC005262 TaxID=3364710 RepID=UPI003696398D